MHCFGRLAVLPPLFIVAALLAFACASVRPESPIAQVPPGIDEISLNTNPDTVRGCTFVADVQGADRWSAGLGQGAGDAARKEAVQEVKQRAAGLKANAVLLIASSAESSGSRLRAEAYRCPATHEGGNR
jgi:hypothetical protein